AGARVTVPHAQTCCGALQAHAGLRDTSRALITENARVFARGSAAGCEAIVTNSAGCGAALRESAHLSGDVAFGALARDVSEVLAALGLPAGAQAQHAPLDASAPLRVAYHDACHLAHAQKVRSAPRELLRGLPGVALVELANSDWCCGSAGVYNLTQPDLADAQLTGKLDTIEAARAHLTVASNPGCLLHMRRGAAARGSSGAIEHLVDVIARAYPA
ncbi:MAG: (Fe-S)-binding protein, partial [Candidatus Eisenbacteria bacterium]|nr:(Fe-S)-binding protein [Candidatus Eisenbacteria bacterium]